MGTQTLPREKIGAETQPSPSWRTWLIGGGLILSMALYYIVANPNIRIPSVHLPLQGINPLYSLPFLAIFAILCWYRFPLAIALLPLSLPFCYVQKNVTPTLRFSLVEITLYTCLGVGILQYIVSLVRGKKWPYQLSGFVPYSVFATASSLYLGQTERRASRSSEIGKGPRALKFLIPIGRTACSLFWCPSGSEVLRENGKAGTTLRERFGPFLWPIALFFLAALVSIVVAFSRGNAERAFREEVFGPLLYLLLAFLCLRSRQDMTRLLLALFGSGLLIALLGCIQYFFFKNTIVPDIDGARRITAVYGSGNGIGTFFDYTFPIGLALVFSRLAWKWRILALLCCLPFLFVLYESGSRGALLLGIPAALVFLIAFTLRNRKRLLIVASAFLLAVVLLGGFYSHKIINGVLDAHVSSQGQSTVLERPWLWLTALHMIHDHPWFGVGMDNWLCYYSNSYYNICLYPNGFPGGKWRPEPPPTSPVHAYWITHDPTTGQRTGLGDQPQLSHPHNIFLQVWVSIGIFGLLAFLAVLVLFYWTFARLMRYLTLIQPPDYEVLRWILVGIGAAMLAALVQGLGDSSFLEQNLAFCFWIAVAALLLVRAYVGMPWRFLLHK